MLLSEQVDGHWAAIGELLARHAADGLQRPVRPVEERRLLQVLRQVEPNAAIAFCKAGHRQGDVDLGGRLDEGTQHGHLLRIEEDEAVEPDLRPLYERRFGDGFGEPVHHVLRIVGLALHLCREFIRQERHLLQLACQTLIALCQLVRRFAQHIRRQPVALEFLYHI